MESREIIDSLQRMRMGALVGAGWTFAVVAPPALVGYFSRPNGLLWALMAILYAYLGYSGIRALRKGWRSRFVLRVVVPLSLLSVSSVLTGLAYLNGMRP